MTVLYRLSPQTVPHVLAPRLCDNIGPDQLDSGHCMWPFFTVAVLATDLAKGGYLSPTLDNI